MRNRNKLTIFAGLSVALATGIACNDVAKPPTPVANRAAAATPAVNTFASQQQGHDQAAEDNAPRITLADAKKDFDNKAAVFIDTHSKEQFELEHIPGAVNIQPNTIKQNMEKVPKGKKLIVYCS
jgi:hypothetical protein